MTGKIKLGDTITIGSLDYKLEKIDGIVGWSISKAFGMFYKFECPAELYGYPVINMQGAFKYVDKSEIDISGLDTRNVICMDSAFEDCTHLEFLDISMLNTQNLRSANLMFSGCSSLKAVQFGSIDLSNLKIANSMFRYCYKLRKLKLTDKEMSSLVDLAKTFFYCDALTELDISSMNLSHAEDMTRMFTKCSSIKKIAFGKSGGDIVKTLRFAFQECSNLEVLDIRDIELSPDCDKGCCYGTFNGCNKLKILITKSSIILNSAVEYFGEENVTVINVNDVGNIDNILIKARLLTVKLVILHITNI